MHDSIEATNRAHCYKLLAACFCEPDQELFLEEKVCQFLQNHLRPLAPEAASAAAIMDKKLKTLNQERLTIDYASLFVGPFELAAAPYSSVYLEENRRIMGESTMQVLRFYQDAGVRVEVEEPPDHIAIMLEFMYLLCTKEAQARQAGENDKAIRYRDIQKDFFQMTLEPWLGKFCKSIRSGTTNEFYHALADCLERFIENHFLSKNTAT